MDWPTILFYGGGTVAILFLIVVLKMMRRPPDGDVCTCGHLVNMHADRGHGPCYIEEDDCPCQFFVDKTPTQKRADKGAAELERLVGWDGDHR